MPLTPVQGPQWGHTARFVRDVHVEGPSNGKITVAPDAWVYLHGWLSGALTLEGCESRVYLQPGCLVRGVITVAPGALMTVYEGAAAAGMIVNDGTIEVGGQLAGMVTGNGETTTYNQGRIVEPTRAADGSLNYNFDMTEGPR